MKGSPKKNNAFRMRPILIGVFVYFSFILYAFAAGADLNGDGTVNQSDLAILIAQFRSSGSADINSDGIVNNVDAGILLSSWGIVTPPDIVLSVPASIDEHARAGLDVAQELADWINNGVNGAGVGQEVTYRLTAGVTYSMRGVANQESQDSNLPIVDKQHIIIDGNGATISAEPAVWNSRLILIRRGENIGIRNLRVVGTNTVSDVEPGFGAYNSEREVEHAVAIQGTQGIFVENVFVDAIWGDCVYVGQSSTGDRIPARNVRISQLTCDRNGRQGIASGQNTEGLLIEDFTLLHGRRGGIDLEPAGAGPVISNVEIRNFYINTRLIPIPSGGGGTVENVSIHHGRIENSAVVVQIGRSDNPEAIRRNWEIYEIENVNVLGGPNSPFRVFFAQNIHIHDNRWHIMQSRTLPAVSFVSASGQLVITNNDFTGASAIYEADVGTDLSGLVEFGNTR